MKTRMKFSYIIRGICTFAIGTVLLQSCASTSSNRSDYFGYNNDPEPVRRVQTEEIVAHQEPAHTDDLSDAEENYSYAAPVTRKIYKRFYDPYTNDSWYYDEWISSPVVMQPIIYRPNGWLGWNSWNGFNVAMTFGRPHIWNYWNPFYTPYVDPFFSSWYVCGTPWYNPCWNPYWGGPIHMSYWNPYFNPYWGGYNPRQNVPVVVTPPRQFTSRNFGSRRGVPENPDPAVGTSGGRSRGAIGGTPNPSTQNPPIQTQQPPAGGRNRGNLTEGSQPNSGQIQPPPTEGRSRGITTPDVQTPPINRGRNFDVTQTPNKNSMPEPSSTTQPRPANTSTPRFFGGSGSSSSSPQSVPRMSAPSISPAPRTSSPPASSSGSSSRNSTPSSSPSGGGRSRR